MSTQIQFRRGSTTDHSTFTGAVGEITVDTTKKTVVVHDATTAGGFPLALESSVSNAVNKDGSVVMTGSLQIGAGFGVVLEGTTADAYETTLVAGDPTADRTVTLPDASTTLAGLGVAQTFSVDQTFAGDVILSGAGKGVIFEGTTADAFETTLVAGEPTADRTITLPDATTTLAGLGVAETFTAPQRGTITTDNDGSFDQSVTNNFKCTPTGAVALTFTNHTAGQSGLVLAINTSNYAFTAAATTYIAAADLTKLSATGTYLIAYLDDGTNAYCTVTAALTSAGA